MLSCSMCSFYDNLLKILLPKLYFKLADIWVIRKRPEYYLDEHSDVNFAINCPVTLV